MRNPLQGDDGGAHDHRAATLDDPVSARERERYRERAREREREAEGGATGLDLAGV